MGAIRLTRRYRWIDQVGTPTLARDLLLELVLHRLDEVAGAQLDALWPAIHEWRHGGREHDELSPGRVDVVFHDHWGLLAAALHHWATVLLELAPRTRDLWLAQRGLALEQVGAAGVIPSLVLIDGALGWIEHEGVRTERGFVADAALPPGKRVEVERLRRSGACCWLCHPAPEQIDRIDLHGAPLGLWEWFRLRHADPASTLRRFLSRPLAAETKDSMLEADFGAELAARAPEVVAAALRSALLPPRRRARALLALVPSLEREASVAEALAELVADEAAAAREIAAMRSIAPPRIADDPVARLVDLIDRRALTSSADVDVVNEAWAASCERESMLELLERGARVMLLVFERNGPGDFVVGEYDDELRVVARRRLRLSDHDGAAALRAAVPKLPETARWIEQLDPFLAPSEQHLSDVAAGLRRYGRALEWWRRLDLAEAFDASEDPRALLDVLAAAGQQDALVAAHRAIRQTLRSRAPRSLSPVGLADVTALDSELAHAIRRVVGYVAHCALRDEQLLVRLEPHAGAFELARPRDAP